jgi:hypothetical protein
MANIFEVGGAPYPLVLTAVQLPPPLVVSNKETLHEPGIKAMA